MESYKGPLKSTWLTVDPLLTYLLVFVPSNLTVRYIGDEFGEFILNHQSKIGDPILKPWLFRVCRRLYIYIPP